MANHYTHKGLYNAYDKTHKEREALDYYATPTEEVLNILEELNIDFSNSIILEPSCGGGHMALGIHQYLTKTAANDVTLICTDIKNRESNIPISKNTGEEYDFLSDNYPFDKDYGIDYVIMNPPYSTIIPFTQRALDISNKGVVLLGRLQYLESEKRFLEIFQENPPSDIYVLVDRIACYKNGDFSKKADSAQAYCWCYWDKSKENKDTRFHWLRRYDKKESH